MNELNSVLVEGKLTGDPELVYLPNGVPQCNFVILTKRFYKDAVDGHIEEDSSTFLIRSTGRLAEICMEHLRTERKVRVVGRLQACGASDLPGTRNGVGAGGVYIAAEHVEFKPEKLRTDE